MAKQRQIRVTVKNHKLLAELQKELEIEDASELVNFVLLDYRRKQPRQLHTSARLMPSKQSIEEML